MAQNVTVQGASYTDVPAVELPKTGGGTATFTDVTDTTAAAADVASGKYFYTAAGVKTQGTASGGGGGASNVVTGTFKGTTTAAAMDVTLAYTGNGWPIWILIEPKEGAYKTDGAFYNLVQRYAMQNFIYVKNDPSVEPTYTSTGSSTGRGHVYASHKSSSSSSTSIGVATYVGSNGVALCSGADASGNNDGQCVKMKSKNKMSVYIASTSYGFAANIEYTYYIIYSS